MTGSNRRNLIRNAITRIGIYPVRVRNPRVRGRTTVHFLHIGKNAGTQVSHLARAINAAPGPVHIVTHGHDVQLRHLPHDARYFFSIRDPITRFRSGFYNRKNRAQPVEHVAWSAHEAKVFAQFDHANDLAEALSAEGSRGDDAWAAMQSIRHAAQHQSDWFLMAGHFLNVRPPVHILRQEHLAGDLQTLGRKLDLDGLPPLRTEVQETRKTDYSDIPELSELARANLADWYRRDQMLYDACERWITAHPA